MKILLLVAGKVFILFVLTFASLVIFFSSFVAVFSYPGFTFFSVKTAVVVITWDENLHSLRLSGHDGTCLKNCYLYSRSPDLLQALLFRHEQYSGVNTKFIDYIEKCSGLLIRYYQ